MTIGHTAQSLFINNDKKFFLKSSCRNQDVLTFDIGREPFIWTSFIKDQMVHLLRIWITLAGSILRTMVLISDGNSEIGVHVRSNLCYLICSRDLLRQRAVTNRIFFPRKRSIFLHACATCSAPLSNLSTMIKYLELLRDWVTWELFSFLT